MADVNLNALVDGLSGKVGKKIVLRQRGGRTMLSTLPVSSGVVTEKQKRVRERFTKATQYARGALLVPELKELYTNAAKGDAFMNAFTIAVTDYLTPPRIARVNTDNYKGVIGDPILIVSVDDYKITSVTVTIQQADGTLIETGTAVKEESQWKYVATQANAELAGSKLIIFAKDRPGNEGTFEQIL